MNTNPQIKLIGLRIFYFKQAIRPLGGGILYDTEITPRQNLLYTETIH